MKRLFTKFALVCFFINNFCAEAGDIVFVDVGQGNTTLVRFREEAPLIIDSGSIQLRGKTKIERKQFKSHAVIEIRKKVESFLLPFKKSENSYDLNVVISHAHEDHYNLIAPILDNDWMKQKKIGFILGGKKAHYDLKRESQKLLSVVERYQTTQIFAEDFASEDVLPDFGYPGNLFKIITAPRYESADPNDYSVVLRVQVGNSGCLLTGDATGMVTSHILARYNTSLDQLRSTIYQASHHGSSSHYSNDQNFIDAIKPEYAIFSSGTKYNHPSDIVVRRVMSYVQKEPKYHILRYYSPDFSASGIVDDKDTTKCTHYKSTLTSGYVFSVTQMRIFNTQDQRTLSFLIDATSLKNSISHAGIVKDDANEFTEIDIEE
jgi:hypothetical protein